MLLGRNALIPLSKVNSTCSVFGHHIGQIQWLNIERFVLFHNKIIIADFEEKNPADNKHGRHATKG